MAGRGNSCMQYFNSLALAQPKWQLRIFSGPKKAASSFPHHYKGPSGHQSAQSDQLRDTIVCGDGESRAPDASSRSANACRNMELFIRRI